MLKSKGSQEKKVPAPPFITSTLQQEASRRLGFQAKRTMKAAQELYEGIDLPKMGAVGLITYMRTDSLRISDERSHRAQREYITGKYGQQYLPEKTCHKKRNQHAGCARGNSSNHAVDDAGAGQGVADPRPVQALQTGLERFTASQMADALLDTVSQPSTAAIMP